MRIYYTETLCKTHSSSGNEGVRLKRVDCSYKTTRLVGRQTFIVSQQYVSVNSLITSLFGILARIRHVHLTEAGKQMVRIRTSTAG